MTQPFDPVSWMPMLLPSTDLSNVVGDGRLQVPCWDSASQGYITRPLESAPLVNAGTGALTAVASLDASSVPVTSICFTGVAPTLNSIATPYAGRRLMLIAFGGPLVIANEATADAVAANRLTTGNGASITIPQYAAAEVISDGQRWRLAGARGGLIGARSSVKPPIFGELQTAAAGVASTPIASYTMVDESFCAFDAYVTMARRTNVTKAGAYKRTVAYRRTGGAASVVVGTPPAGVDEETTAADDVTFTVSGNTIRVTATAADTDGRNWSCELRVQETLAT